MSPFVAGLWARPAAAYPRLPIQGNCNRNDINFVFVGSNWNHGGPGEDYESEWLYGSWGWSGINDRYGNPFWSSNIGNTEATYRMTLSGAELGAAQCTFNGTWANDFFLDDATTGAEVFQVAEHETGHGHGMEHSGTPDDDIPPVMSTCNDFTAHQLDKDDLAHALNTVEITVHANPSFENGSQGWTPSSATITVMNGTGSEGPHFLRVLGSGGSVHQWVRQADTPPAYKMRANYWAPTGSTGTITFKMTARDVAYPTPGSNLCEYHQFIHNWDLNNPGIANPIFYDVGTPQTVTPNNVWHYADTGAWDPSAHDAVDLRIVVYKNTSNYLYLDNVRAYQN